MPRADDKSVLHVFLDPEVNDELGKLALDAGVSKSVRVEQLIKADLEYWKRKRVPKSLNVVSCVADLLPRHYGKQRKLAKETGIPIERIRAIALKEIPDRQIEDWVLKELAQVLDVDVKELFNLKESDNDSNSQNR